MPGLVVIPLTALPALSLPVLLPLVAVLTALDRLAETRAAARTACGRCGRTLGRDCLERASADAAARFAAFRTAHPLTRPRMPPGPRPVCAACGARYGFDTRRRAFTPWAADAD